MSKPLIGLTITFWTSGLRAQMTHVFKRHLCMVKCPLAEFTRTLAVETIRTRWAEASGKVNLRKKRNVGHLPDGSTSNRLTSICDAA